jgi:hypothetical protein
MTTDHVEQSTAFMARVEAQELIPHAVRLLAGGEPVALEHLAAAAGWFVDDARAALGAQSSAERDVVFASDTLMLPAAAAAWADAHPDGQLYPVAEAFQLDREVIRQLGWDATRAA